MENGALNGESASKKKRSCSYPVDLDLEWVLGSMPRKVRSIVGMQRSQVDLNILVFFMFWFYISIYYVLLYAPYL